MTSVLLVTVLHLVPAGTVRHVTVGGSGDFSGVNWANAMQHPQVAMDVASPGDEIWVAAGVYVDIDTDSRVLWMSDGVGVYGGFDGTETARDERDWAANVTIFDGEDVCYHVVQGASNVVLDGFVITGGNANGAAPDNRGAGMHISMVANVQVINCTFAANHAYGWGGGAIFNYESSPVITDCTFADNHADDWGGGAILSSGSSSPVVTDCTFWGNSADGGGAISTFGPASLSLQRCAFTGNTAVSNGGALYDSSTSSTILDCVFALNAAGNGGGVFAFDASPSMVNCVLDGNIAVASGGGVYNQAVGAASPVLMNCTLSGNSASNGGGLRSVDCTPEVRNCVVWGNAAGSNPQIGHSGSGATTVSYSDIGQVGGFTDAGGNISLDPLFVGASVGNLRLRQGSPCIDMGTDVGAPADDFDGNPRPYNGLYDMGAFEHQGEAYYVWYVSPGGMGDGSSWARALPNPQDALGAAWSGDEIWVAEGTYRPTTSADRAISFWLAPGVALYGGFEGAPGTEGEFTSRDWNAYVTALSGDIGAPGDNSDNSYHVVWGADNATLDGLTVTGGNADSATVPDGRGGGMYNDGVAGLTLANCTFSDNSGGWGGGIANWSSSSPVIIDCAFSNNAADYGGGAYNSGGTPVIANCTFAFNTAIWYGGGMDNISSATTLVTNCTFRSNWALNGGGMYNGNASPTITNCTFSDNTASGDGGALYNTGSAFPTVSNCVLWGDSAPEIYVDGTSTCTVSYSDVDQVGGFTDAGGNINADPLFVDAASGDLHLTPASPCVDAGDNAAVVVTMDLDGNPRIADGDGNSVDVVDMGAYELPPPPPLVWHVTVGGSGDMSGVSWANAMPHPQDAMDMAAAGEEVWVAGGTYVRRIVTDTVLLQMWDGVGVYGGFAGWETLVDERDPATNVTTLDGEDVCYHVVVGASDGTLDGFTVTGGHASGAIPNDRGGGMYTEGTTNLAVANCTFANNVSDASGGGMANCYGSSPTVTNSSFSGNTAPGSGGGMYNYQSSPTVIDCRFLGNLAAYGAAIGNGENSPTIQNCTFWNNSSDYGGAISNWTSTAVVVNCSFSRNMAANFGGVIYDYGSSSPTVTNCILWGNSAPSGQEIYDETGSSCTVAYSAIDQVGGFNNSIGNIDADPLFVDAAGGDLHLRECSPCIDSADGPAAPPLDLDGNTRRDDPGMPNLGPAPPWTDMGAYEFQADSPAITVSAPNAGSDWAIDATMTIAWTTTGTVDWVDILISRDGGAWNAIATSQANTGNRGWTVTGPASGNCIIKVCNSQWPGLPFGDSGVFTISDSSNSPPTVSLSAGPTSGTAPLFVNFDAGSWDPEGDTLTHEWDWNGDGTYDYSSGTDATVSYTFDTAGVYPVVVRVSDPTHIVTDSVDITVTSGSNEPPNVAVSSPSDGATVSGVVYVAADAWDDDGTVDKVEFYIDGGQETTDFAAPYEYNWTSTAVSNGWHTIMARAHDDDGDWKDATISVNVQNAVPNQPPNVSITSPLNNDFVEGWVIVTVDAWDSDGNVTRVDLYVGGGYVATDSSVPYSFDFDSTKWPEGWTEIKVRTRDDDGAWSEDSIIVNIENDADGDGIHDWWEEYHFGDIAACQPGDDPDNDGLDNLGEFHAGSDPWKWDTDGDGIPDGEDPNPTGLAGGVLGGGCGTGAGFAGLLFAFALALLRRKRG